MADFLNRITILSPANIDEIYGLPKFSKDEQYIYLSMDKAELSIADSHRSLETKLFFIIQLGYFKAKRLFFIPKYADIKEDIIYASQRYFPESPVPENIEINRITRWKQQQKILKLFGYQECDILWRKKLVEKACQTVRISTKPIYIFNELLVYLAMSKVVFPAYSTFQDIISKAIVIEIERLSGLVNENITDDIKKSLNSLLSIENNTYLITTIKKEPKNFKLGQISQEISIKHLLEPLYCFAKEFLPKLDISQDNVKYYSKLVDYYNVFRIKRLEDNITIIYLLCFIYHRYQRINDNLINTFIYQTRKIIENSKKAANLRIINLKMEGNRYLPKVSKVMNLFVDDTISNDTLFGNIRKQAFGILEEDKFSLVSRYISKYGFDHEEIEWLEIEKYASVFKINIRPLLLTLNFKSVAANNSLMESVDFLKKNIIEKKNLSTLKLEQFPQSIINRKLKRYIVRKYKKKICGSSRTVMEIFPNRYEFLVYMKLCQNLESGDVYISDSIKFKSFEDDLIDNQQWENKERFIKQLNKSYISRPIEETLAELKEELEKAIVDVNQRISDGKNKEIKIKGTGDNVTWTLPYKKQDDLSNNPLFEKMPQIEIFSLLSFVDSQCGFMTAFTHFLERYVKNEADNNAILGALIALATNKGLVNMADSSDLSYQSLFAAMKNYLRQDTLKKANDINL
ncbi:MAG: Tn3 family transposase [Desulfobacterales bacterium]|nr:Tn3 family transposase [Desulfobacterales bacterium]